MALELVIDESGATIPTFNEVQAYLIAAYQGIYGADIYLDNDSQDGQLVGIFALAISQNFNAALAVFNSFSPSKAIGAGLSSNVKINGLTRAIPSNSSVDLLITGTAGAIITDGIASDENSTVDWLLPASVVIPPSGEITVTATAAITGAIQAAADTITKRKTLQFGWDSVTNPDAASVGAPVESDAFLRQRQAVSTQFPSQTILQGIEAGIRALPGVTRVMAYENDTDVTDANGLPEHSLSMVVTGGDATQIAQVIANKKSGGCYTYGDVIVPLYIGGVTVPIRFFRPDVIEIKLTITLDALPGYTSAIGAAVKQALADYVNALADGGDVFYTRLFLPANLFGAPESLTYEVTAMQIALLAGSFGTADIPIAFNDRASLLLANITLIET